MVFALDANNYQAHVFAGLATLQSGKQQEAKQHYQSAITIAPQEQLAWKVLSDMLYDVMSYYCRVWLTCTVKE